MPGVLYVITGTESVDEDGVPPGNVQLQEVGFPFQERSVNVKLEPWQTVFVVLSVAKSAVHNTEGVLTPVAVKLEVVHKLLRCPVVLARAARIRVFCPAVNMLEQ